MSGGVHGPATPLPWRRMRSWSRQESVIEGENEGGKPCHVMGPALNADAAYALRAANCHHELLEALEGARIKLLYIYEVTDDTHCGNEARLKANEIERIIAKACGQ